MKTLILKIGGSVITKKELSAPALRVEIIEEIGRILKTHSDSKEIRLILIHGAGSFGHILAKRYSLQNGTKDHPEKIPQALEVQESVTKLHTEIMRLFKACNLPVQSFPTHQYITNDKGSISQIETNPLKIALGAGLIPVLYGDMIPDLTWGYSVCSGDEIVAELSQIFSAESVFFASDVNGIYTKDPHVFKDATLIPETTLQEIISRKIQLDESHNTDVTGGLSKKFSLFKDSPALENIYLFNGLIPKNFEALFQKESFLGTRIQVKK